MKPKLTLQYIAPYLPYQVKARFKETNCKEERRYCVGTVGAVYSDASICCYDTVNATPDKFKLLLRPMSALDEKALTDINCDLSDQIITSEIRDKQIGYWNAPYNVIQILLKHHYDLFGLIEQGLAIKIND